MQETGKAQDNPMLSVAARGALKGKLLVTIKGALESAVLISYQKAVNGKDAREKGVAGDGGINERIRLEQKGELGEMSS